MRAVFTLAVLAGLLLPAAAQQGAGDRAGDSEWIAHCIAQISETNRPRAQAYCVCMAESIDTSEKLRQTDLERSFPPLHRDCFRKAGFKTPN